MPVELLTRACDPKTLNQLVALSQSALADGGTGMPGPLSEAEMLEGRERQLELGAPLAPRTFVNRDRYGDVVGYVDSYVDHEAQIARPVACVSSAYHARGRPVDEELEFARQFIRLNHFRTRARGNISLALTLADANFVGLPFQGFERVYYANDFSRLGQALAWVRKWADPMHIGPHGDYLLAEAGADDIPAISALIEKHLLPPL